MSSSTHKPHKYGIIVKSCEIYLQSFVLTELKDDQEKLIVEAGAMIKRLGQCSINNSNYINIQILDFYDKNPIWENMYQCCADDIKDVDETLWPFVIAIADPVERLTFVLNTHHRNDIVRLKRGDIVTASGEPFRKDAIYDCIIRYIGLVPQIGPGYYFGLELLNLKNGYSPQVQDVTFIGKYMGCDPNLGLILSANWINPNSHRKSTLKHKFSARDFLCGTLNRTKTIIDTLSGNDITRNYGTAERRNSKRISKSPTTPRRSYSSNRESINSTSDLLLDKSNGTKDSDNDKTVMDQRTYSKHPTSSVTSSSSAANHFRKDKSTNTNFHKTEDSQFVDDHEKVSEKESKDHRRSTSVKSENLITLDNEDIARFVENYERNLERQHECDQGTKQNIPPVSILKQTKTATKKKTNFAIGVKPNTIMSLEDRDIVVIDKADIKESTKNESEVIVVDNPRTQKEVDLAELLGQNWPTTAGDTALVLNTDNKPANNNMHNSTSSSNSSSASSFQVRNERNKSVNPISHLINTKPIEKRSNKENVKIQTESANMDSGMKTFDKKIKNTEPIYDNTNGASAQIIAVSSPDEEVLAPSPLNEIPGTNLGVGSVVEVSTDVCEDLYGVIRWIGFPQASKSVMVGVELEDEQVDIPLVLTDGTHNGVRLFKCPNGRGLFVHPSQCSKDRRFLDIELPTAPQIAVSKVKALDTKTFGQMDCPPVPGAIAPLKIQNLDELEAICGKFKGIQGHHNSCYLDATLFAMFTFTGVFDSLLFRPPEPEDISHYEEVQKVLREELVNPLRKNVFVRADRVMKLRQLLEKLSSVSGLTCEEKDPEEFLNSLLAQIMRADPFLKLSSGQDAFYYQLFVEKDERLSFPSVQQLFEQSFLASDIKLKEVPSCLIIQMPRFGKNYKMYPRILPSQVLDVTDIIEDSPRQCCVCGKLAEFECRECFGILQCGSGLESTAFCKKCLETVHSHAKRSNHTPKEISVPQDFKIMAEDLTVPRLFMELFAVVCIETSHYVAFVKAGSGLDAPWCFFDSMADRKGEQNGYNIPEMVSVPDLPQWLSEEGARVINEAANDKLLPEHAKRLLCDAYMCMYQSTDVMMYR